MSHIPHGGCRQDSANVSIFIIIPEIHNPVESRADFSRGLQKSDGKEFCCIEGML
jgi:hypothetical protein